MTDMVKEIADVLTAAGLPVTTSGNRVRGVVVKAHGEGVCELHFRPERPASLPAGLPWNADVDADLMVARVGGALLGHYAVSRTGAGRATVLRVARLEGKVAA
jgi:hypothetical protein